MLKPRPLVDIAAAVSSALLMNELQWVGLIVRPIDYSLKGAILHVDTGPGLMIEESCRIEIEHYKKAMEHGVHAGDSNIPTEGASSSREFEELLLENGKLALPDWASDISTVLWFPVRAIDNRMARGISAGLVVAIILSFIIFCILNLL